MGIGVVKRAKNISSMGSVLFFLKKEPKTLALRGFNNGNRCFLKKTSNISFARDLRVIDSSTGL
jgi:hypothetical protein